ncbi:Glycosyltransferase involved in cell wall bisynthesis [Rhizobium tibeticum]|uniref:GalNAc(5)-diNAcBac-PP-undecaprenol beta-1,3-glucosyltransferase n=1 Tax=Rhizobium tibeticum TaxID=501024 RepID=A0A1H8NTN7_9HYPH|nr:glycosyltransferase family 2 protein [Rhizobium tibeticum]SEI00412.1 GalNAc(5)-diNAcBac-PP-undecaprenol beta-1,3-glucosyltransferase [Rhizobium tibeticum]SEO32964.1 Glycosyltransferase involved in cell wall bisynthesis [Rhizobium tibeticum]
MGAVSFSLDSRLIDALNSALELHIFVETGTFRGDTVARVASQFDRIFSIELSESLWNDASTRFQSALNITVLNGRSSDKLAEIRTTFEDRPTLFWLDAHWCIATGTAGELSQCPLLDELKAIEHLNAESVILIDDARLFLAPPLAPHEISQWPNFDQIVRQLFAMSEHHEVMVINDVIAFFPRRARAAVETYAQDFGTDWLIASNSLKQNGTAMNELTAKETVIQGLTGRVRQQTETIANLSAEVKYFHDLYNALPLPLRALARANLRMTRIVRPRLGQLNQYSPRPLSALKNPLLSGLPIAQPKISIVTPSFAQGRFIERTLRSVLDQQYANLEYVVQDGGSHDETIDVLKRYDDRLAGWASEQDTGQSQAINRGFAGTSGEIMAWLNSDDLLLPGSLAIIADFFDRNPDVDVVYGNRLMIDEADMEIGRWILPGHDSAVLSWADYIPQETLFWRRRIWEKAGGRIDETFRFAMDWDLLVRFRDAGAKFAHIPQFLGAFRIHEHQKTSAAITEVGFEEMDRIRKRTLGKVSDRAQIRRATAPFLLRHIVADLGYRIKTGLKSRSTKFD